MPDDVADYEEALRLLTELARKGNTQATVALASHLRRGKPEGESDSGSQSAILSIAARRAS